MEKLNKKIEKELSYLWSPPYIGDAYLSKDNFFKGKRILTLGHSQYCGNCKNGCNPEKEFYKIMGKCPNSTGTWTRDMAEDYIMYCLGTLKNEDWGQILFDKKFWEEKTSAERKDTFSKFAYSLGAEQDNKKDYIRIWDAIVFYNFLQTGVQVWDGTGSDSQYIDSKTLFIEVLKTLSAYHALPEFIIVWGKKTPQYLEADANFEWCNNERTSAIYHLKDDDNLISSIPMVFINHPCCANKNKNLEIIKNVAPELFTNNQ